MNPILLGTGAAEGIPCVFCECPVCTRARARGGRDVRSRSSLLLDEYSIVDFSRDLFHQMLSIGQSLRGLERIFLTHFHEDHISVEEMSARSCAVPPLSHPIRIFCSEPAAEQLRLLINRFHDHNLAQPFDYFERFQLCPVEPFHPFAAGAWTITPLLSSHHSYGVGEIGYNYLYAQNGETLLYAVDTGWYPPVTWDYLRGSRLNGVILECTYGDQPLPARAPEHLNRANALDMLEHLRSLGCISEKTPCALTHICHLHSQSWQETQDSLRDCGFSLLAGYDGMPFPCFGENHSAFTAQP